MVKNRETNPEKSNPLLSVRKRAHWSVPALSPDAPDFLCESGTPFGRCGANDGDGCGHFHCIAFAFHRQHCVDPLAQGPRALRVGVELPSETPKPDTPQHKPNRRIPSPPPPSHVPS